MSSVYRREKKHNQANINVYIETYGVQSTR